MRLKYRLRNKTDGEQEVTVSPRVLDEGKEVLGKTLFATKPLFESKRVKIEAGGAAEVWFEASWPDAKYWFPHDPHLYCLETRLGPPLGASDCHRERFGFREIWGEGYSWYLNGERVKLRGSYTNSGNCCDFYPGHPVWTIYDPEGGLEAYWTGQTEQVRNFGMDVSRTAFEETCDMADEVGLMNKKQTEFAGFCQPSFTLNDKFWQGGLETNIRQMNASKNHPSVIYWEAGNETMWMHIFLGQVPKAFTSHWQFEIAKAMRNFDLQKRPIDWDADSDLFGKWESCSLHYPRELSVYPDIPNSAWWGPWDGKIVTPEYMFGPITLGKKPVNVGESFWLTPSLPYQPTILVGDAAYAGGDRLGKAWDEITRYFVNGYRDAEFTYMDTQPLLPPHDFAVYRSQVLVFKQETSEFYGGRTITRDVNIHNDVMCPAKLTVRWSLRREDGREMAPGGERQFAMDAAELKRWSVDVRLPRVDRVVAATWRMDLLEGQALLHTEERQWKIAPLPAFDSIAGVVSLFDPVGETAAGLDRLGVKYNRVGDLAKLSGRSVVIGKNAFSQALQGRVERGAHGVRSQGRQGADPGAGRVAGLPADQRAGRQGSQEHDGVRPRGRPPRVARPGRRGLAVVGG